MPKFKNDSIRAAQRINPLGRPDPASFDCIACMETVEGSPAAVIHSCEICQACFDEEGGIRQQFQIYLKDETKQPKWAGKEIFLNSVKHQFSPRFIEQYQTRLAEYSVLPAQRFYCAQPSCNDFLGHADSRSSFKHCKKCDSFTCSACKSTVTDRQNHVCDDPMDINDPDPFQGLVKGSDYQFCPNPDCKAPVTQIEGCNHMVCEIPACNGTEFCYICGKPAEHFGDHWQDPKGCPKYGRLGDPRAIFDEPIPDVVNNVDADSEEMEDLQDAEENDPFVNLNGPAERTLRVIDRFELDNIITNGHDLMDAYGPDLPHWYMSLHSLAHELFNTLDFYTLHLEPANAEVTDVSIEEQGLVIQDMAASIPLIGWQQFPRLRPIVDTYLLALASEPAQVAAQLAVRQEAAHQPRRRRHSEVALPATEIDDSAFDGLAEEWP